MHSLFFALKWRNVSVEWVARFAIQDGQVSTLNLEFDYSGSKRDLSPPLQINAINSATDLEVTAASICSYLIIHPFSHH